MDISTYKQDWEGLYDKSKWILSEVNKKIASYITRIEFIDEKLELVNISDAHDTLLQSQTELIAKEQELASFNAQEQDIFAQIVALKSGIETCKNTIHLINTTKEQQQAYHAKKKELTEQSDKLTADLKNYKSITAISNDLKLANENIMSVTVKLSGITKQLQKYKVSNGKCPILDTECPQVTLLKEKASEWTTEQEVLTISLSAFTKSKDMIQTAHDAVFSINQQLHSISQSFFMLGDAPEPPEDVNIYLTKQSDLEQQLIKLEGAFDSDFKERLLQSITQLQQRIPILESTIKSYNDYSNEKEMYDAKVSSVESKKKIVSVATKLLSPHGLPYYLSLKLLTTLEQYTNEFLKFMDTSVYITPYKVLNSMEDTCIIDGYKFKANDEVCPVCNNKREKKIESQITIYSGDRGIPLDGESTGRKAIFFTALRFGLMKLLNTQGKILIVDEVFANLDDTNKQKLLDMINHASKELNIEQIFIVSNDELKDILPVTVSVTRLADKSIIA